MKVETFRNRRKSRESRAYQVLQTILLHPGDFILKSFDHLVGVNDLLGSHAGILVRGQLALRIIPILACLPPIGHTSTIERLSKSTTAMLPARRLLTYR